MEIRTPLPAPPQDLGRAVSPAVPPERSAAPTAHSAVPGVAQAKRPLDLRGMAPPLKLSEARLEDLTIDGICGVY